MKARIVYAVRSAETRVPGRFVWLEDTCAGGAWSTRGSDAKTWADKAELLAELVASELAPSYTSAAVFEVVELVEFER